MKYVLALALAAVSMPVFAAVGPNSSWSEIEAAGLTANFPKQEFTNVNPNNGGLVFVSVDNVCVDGSNLKTIKPVTICTEWSNDEASACVKVESVSLSIAREFHKTLPAGPEGDETIPYDGFYPVSYNVAVGSYAGPEGDFATSFYKQYSLPACAE